jgi:altronate dehydratase
LQLHPIVLACSQRSTLAKLERHNPKAVDWVSWTQAARNKPISTDSIPLQAIGRLPAPKDNVAIAVRRIEVGTSILLFGSPRTFEHTILEGHRFAVEGISKGEKLLSWGLPFGVATTDIEPGEYVCNQSMLEALSTRQISSAKLPEKPNFEDLLEPHSFDEKSFRPGAPIERAIVPRTFSGFRRPGVRGVGTRNFIVVLGTTSRTASFARLLASRLQSLVEHDSSLDGIVAVAHTEGGGIAEPNNTNEVLKSLAGFMVHPNVGAVLAVDYGAEPITNLRLEEFMHAQGYAIDDVPHRFLTLKNGLAAGLAEGEAVVRGWIPGVASNRRTPEPLSGLRIALQCGGSDAFSGVSGNPLAGAMVHEAIRHGGTGVLTETDEAVGAEAYVLRNVRDLSTSKKFLEAIDEFKTYLSWHGVSSESNPSGGNKFRGLYNIALKSVGAVHKKDPRTPLDFVTSYADPLSQPGFYFMNGPGNDLEGIAGQVASGCNLILFVTGNGSVTNFPFVPTLKITTTTRRHQLLIHEMDINAGSYLDGESFDSLAAEAFETMIAAASGTKTKGERAGHSQVSLWRNWPQTNSENLSRLQAKKTPDGLPLLIAPTSDSYREIERPLRAYRTENGFATERLGLVLPLSLCSSQIARLAADRLNNSSLAKKYGISRFVALTHTEACGSSGESLFQLLHRSYMGYITHPNVAAAVLLEHGCEKITNDAMRHELQNAGIDSARFGWGSVQLDGGIAKVQEKIENWFCDKLACLGASAIVQTNLGSLSVGLMTAGPINDSTAETLASVARSIVSSGGSIVIPESDPLLANDLFRKILLGTVSPHATLAYGQTFTKHGLHIVDSETEHWVENLTCLGACGAHLILAIVDQHTRQGHPMLSVVQVAESDSCHAIAADDIDLILVKNASKDREAIEAILVQVAQGQLKPAANAHEFVDFQFSRGLLGVTS